jgi:hypothetical protein
MNFDLLDTILSNNISIVYEFILATSSNDEEWNAVTQRLYEAFYDDEFITIEAYNLYLFKNQLINQLYCYETDITKLIQLPQAGYDALNNILNIISPQARRLFYFNVSMIVDNTDIQPKIKYMKKTARDIILNYFAKLFDNMMNTNQHPSVYYIWKDHIEQIKQWSEQHP